MTEIRNDCDETFSQLRNELDVQSVSTKFSDPNTENTRSNRSIYDSLNSSSLGHDIYVSPFSTNENIQEKRNEKTKEKDIHKITEIESIISSAEVETNTNTSIKYVSQEYYDNEFKKFHEMKTRLINVEKLFQNFAKKLPDKGNRLKCQIQNLQCDVLNKEQFIKTLVIKNEVTSTDSFCNTTDAPSIKFQQLKYEHQAIFRNSESNFKALTVTAKAIKPVSTSRHEAQPFQPITEEHLKDLQASLETCPDETVLAEEPKGLKVNLMPHQKHALAWMHWRETQKPRGGILADDMGLGKTLTMISLILNCKNRSLQCGDVGGDTDEDDDIDRNIKKFYQGDTLVICPASLIQQWISEISSKVLQNELTIYMYHGQNRETCPKNLQVYNIVITSYNILSRDYRYNGALFSIKWKRIILDEAHIIRNANSQSSIAVYTLKGKYKWVLTGTPVQNKELDIYALLKFLRCVPFDNLSYWKKRIDFDTCGKQRLNTIMKSLMLRRTKTQLQNTEALKILPKKSTKLIEVILNKEEMELYQIFLIYSRTFFVQYLCQRGERHSSLMYETYRNSEFYKLHDSFKKMQRNTTDIKSHEILKLLLILRQICCHSGLISAKLVGASVSQTTVTNCNAEEEQIDLLEDLRKLAITNDNNADDYKTITQALQRSNPVFNLKKSSSKVEKVLSTVKECISNNSDKVIIVSQWTCFLEIIKYHLNQQNIQTLCLNGAIPLHKRQNIIMKFNDAKCDERVLLLSLTAGGIGLNLIGANHLLIVDWHWNPQLHAQAEDRIYRVGQKKNVIIYKFICKDTIEERIKNLHEHKLLLADQVLSGDHKFENSKLTLEEMKTLFSM